LQQVFSLAQLVELGLATWRLSRMAVREDGPFRVFVELREETGIEYVGGRPVSWPDYNPLYCVLCTSVYAGVLLLLVPRWVRRGLAASGIAVLLEEVSACLWRSKTDGS
jgi:hypothetical protein